MNLKDETNQIRRTYIQNRDFDKAFQLLLNIKKCHLDEAKQNDTIPEYQNLGFLDYEIANSEFTRNNFDEAVQYYKSSNDYFKQAEDWVGVAVGDYMLAYAEYYTGKIELQEVYDITKGSLSKLSQFLSDGVESGRCERWIVNIIIQCFYYAAQGNFLEDAQEWHDKLADLEIVRLNNNADELEPPGTTCQNYIYFRMHIASKAILSYLLKDYDASLGYFAEYLDLNLSEWGSRNPYVPMSFDDIVEITRDYWYAGRALKEAGFKERAITAWNKGLSLPVEYSNLYYQNKIRQELERL